MAGGQVTYVLCWSLLVTLTFASTSTTISPDAASKDINYWVSFAKRITPGKPLVAHVYLANLSQPVDLTLDLVDDDNTNLQEGQSFTLQGTGDIQIINFDISNNLTRPQDNSPSPKMFVRVRASRGLLFDEYEEVLWQEPPLNIVVQMSMLKYQPGQTVKFIAFVTSGLHVVKKPLDIVIENDGRYGGTPEKLAEWKQVQSGDKTGVYLGEFNTSSQTPTGNYQISVSAEGAKTYTVRFEVKEYMEFLVEIDYPIIVSASFEQINVSISTRTAIGFPVQGPCSVVAGYPYWGSNRQELVKNISLDTTGKGVVTFTRAELYKLGSEYASPYTGVEEGSSFTFNSSQFYVGVTVTNDVTGNNVTSKASIYFGSGFSGLTVGGLAMNFKPGLSLSNYATVVDYRYSLGGYYPNALIRLNVSYSDGEDTWRNLVQKDVKTDNVGYGLYTIESVPGNATALKIQGTSGNETNSVALPPFRSPSRAFLQLELKTAHVKIKRSVAVEVRSNIAFSSFTVQVYAMGALVMTKVERRSVQDKLHTFTFTMTSEMAPVADVIVFVTTKTGEIAADRLPVGVHFSQDNKSKFNYTLKSDARAFQTLASEKRSSQPNYELKLVTISFSTPKVTRGSAVRVTVEAKPRTKVFLMVWSKLNIFDTIISYQLPMKLTGSLPGGSYSGRMFFQGSWHYQELIDVYRGDYSGVYSYRGPVPVADSFLVVTSMEAALITDGELPGRSNASLILGPQRPTDATRSRSKRQATPPSDTTGAPATADDPQQSGAFYSESWLWETVSIGKKGRKILRLNAPDRVDQWIAFAVAVHPKFGLSWPETTVELQTVESEE